MESSEIPFGSQQITITKAKLVFDNECLAHDLQLTNEQCDQLSLKNRDQLKIISKFKEDAKKQLRNAVTFEESEQKQSEILTTLQEYLDILVDKMNEYEERRVTRDKEVETLLNDCIERTSTHQIREDELIEKINCSENQLQLKINEIEELQGNCNYFQLNFDQKNEELQSALVKIEEQNDLKIKIASLSEKNEEMNKRVISSDEERAFLQEKIVTLIQNERNLEDSLQKQTNQYIHKFDEQQRQIDELTKSKEELDSNLNDQLNDLQSKMNKLEQEFNDQIKTLKEENLKLSKNLDETLTTNANYENISRAELEDQRQSNCRIQLHNDTLLNQVYLMTKESTEIHKKNLDLREEVMALNEKLIKTAEDSQNFKRPSTAKRTSINAEEIEFSSPGSSFKKSKTSSQIRPFSKLRQRNISTESDFSNFDEESSITPESIRIANRAKMIEKTTTFFSQQVQRSLKSQKNKADSPMETFSIESSERNESTE